MNTINIKVIIVIILLLLFVPSCTVKTEIIMDDGRQIIVHSKKDALVEVKEKNKTIIVNNQGKPTLIEQLITLMFMDMKIQKEEVKE